MKPSEKSNSTNKENENNNDQFKNDILKLEDDNNQKTLEDRYVFGWGEYSEITNGRFAMIGFAAIILIELVSKKSFLLWSGIIN